MVCLLGRLEAGLPRPTTSKCRGSSEFVRPWEAGWRQAAGLRALADPGAQIGLRAHPPGPGRPGQPLFAIEGLGIGQSAVLVLLQDHAPRSEEHTSELQSLMRISYAVFCLKKKKNTHRHKNNTT